MIPSGCRIVEGRGRFLLPGFWDAHVHLSKIGAQALPLFVANGVTSVRDMGGDLDEVLGWRHEIATGTRTGPRIIAPGPMFESASNVERMKREGVVEPVARTRIPLSSASDAEALVNDVVRHLANTRRISGVMAAGRYHDRAALDRMLKDARQAARTPASEPGRQVP